MKYKSDEEKKEDIIDGILSQYADVAPSDMESKRSYMRQIEEELENTGMLSEDEIAIAVEGWAEVHWTPSEWRDYYGSDDDDLGSVGAYFDD